MTATRAADDDTTWLDLAGAPRIEGLRFRRPRGDDADYEALAAITVASNRADDIPFLPSAEHLREEFDDLSRSDPTRDVVLAEVAGAPVAEAANVKRKQDHRDGVKQDHLDMAWTWVSRTVATPSVGRGRA